MALTKFGRYLKRKKISNLEAAGQIGCTRSYVQMLATDAAKPGLKTAGKIKEMTHGEVGFEDWIK